MGAQGAGKSSFYRQRFAETHLRINLDMLRTRRRERRLVDVCLAIGQRFVVDNTNPTVEDRARYIAPARAAGFSIVGYRFDLPFEALLARNALREGKARVPEVAIKSTLKRFEEPSLSEGFDSIHRVIADGDGFSIIGIDHEIR